VIDWKLQYPLCKVGNMVMFVPEVLIFVYVSNLDSHDSLLKIQILWPSSPCSCDISQANKAV